MHIYVVNWSVRVVMMFNGHQLVNHLTNKPVLAINYICESPFSSTMAANQTVILITGGFCIYNRYGIIVWPKANCVKHEGANSGIGLETIKALATISSNFCLLLGCRSIEKGQHALSEIQNALGDSIKATLSAVRIDVCNQKSIETAKGQIATQFGKLDVLINNAGIIVYQKVDTMTSLRHSFDTNVFGPLAVTETLESLLRESAKPYVIYVSSEQGSVSLRLEPEYKFRQVRGDHYRMSKAALNMLAACHRYNFADWGCRVLAFNPGWCISNLTGEKGREMRIKGGARDPKDPAMALVDIVLGKRDSDIEKNGMLDLDGGVLPW
jgi:NAD(P)-dependent dehydrogenase (short-subunit alcohol dehydrogenase family)